MNNFNKFLPMKRSMLSSIIIDLDETLVHTLNNVSNKEIYDNIYDETQSYQLNFGENDIMYGYIRPYVNEFIEICFKKFDYVIVWSAGSEEYVNKIVDRIFKKRPSYIYSSKFCDVVDGKRLKPLKKIWDIHDDISKKKTLMIDNYPLVATYNIPNYIQIPDWKADNENDISLYSLMNLFNDNKFINLDDYRYRIKAT